MTVHGVNAQLPTPNSRIPFFGGWKLWSWKLTITLIAIGLGGVVSADGGLLRAHQQAGTFIVSIFTAPEPLRVGPVEVSVLVQSSAGVVLTDAVVDILLESATRPIEQRGAIATQASNAPAQAAVIGLPSAGQWTLTVSVRVGGDAAAVTCLLAVAPAASRMSLIWPWLLVPPFVIALFAAHQTLTRQRSSARPARART